jgi:hypothetical protein
VAQLLETLYQEQPATVDGGVIRSAKLLGHKSRNGRRYEAKALQDAVGLYEGKKVYVNHPSRDETGDRPFGEWAGIIENVRYKDDGLYGDVVLRQESSHFKGIVEAATNPKFSKSCGFSHVADGESHFDGDTEIVESIKEVFSVDLVTDPATTKGIFESEKKRKKKLTTETIQAAIEKLPESTQRTRLIEMAGEYGLGGMSMEPEQGKPADPLGEIATMCRELIKMLGEALVAKNTAPPPAPPVPNANPTGNPNADPNADPKASKESPEEDEEMSDDDKEKIAAFESIQRENAELKASKLLLESGRQATPARMKALANCESDEEQQELLESWPKLEENTRPGRSPAVIESAFDFPRDNPEKFAALLR